MQVNIKINCDNHAFENVGLELSRIFGKLKEKVVDDVCDMPIMDINGNRVGMLEVTE